MRAKSVTAWLTRSAATAAAAGSGSAVLASAGRDLGAAPVSLETVLAAGFAYLGAAIAAYLALATMVVAAEVAATRRQPRTARALPAAARRFLAGGVAVAVAVGTTLPASASDAVSPGWAPTTSGHATPLTREASASPTTPIADHAPTAPVPLPAPAAAPTRPTEDVSADPSADTAWHVVTRGESLWRIAANRLGPGSPDAAIARAWPLIYGANRAVIGDDPGLILPGQRLVIPAGVAS